MKIFLGMLFLSMLLSVGPASAMSLEEALYSYKKAGFSGKNKFADFLVNYRCGVFQEITALDEPDFDIEQFFAQVLQVQHAAQSKSFSEFVADNVPANYAARNTFGNIAQTGHVRIDSQLIVQELICQENVAPEYRQAGSLFREFLHNIAE